MPAKKKRSVPRAKHPGLDVEVSQPHVYRNLSVYFLSPREPQPRRRFTLLRDALQEREVKVAEQAQARVQRLEIQNLGGDPLFLHEGERLRGGRQDRTVRTSLVVPARSRPRPLPAFCIEQTRWGGGGGFRAGGAELAPRQVRLSAKVHGDQGRVWRSVADVKAAARDALQADDRTSSLNEVFDSPQVQRAVEVYLAELGGVLAEHPLACGAAFALGQELEEVDVYATAELFAGVFPRLLASYALEAVLAGGGFADPPEREEVARFMKRTRAKSREQQQIDAENDLTVAHYAGKVECVSAYEGVVVHHQMLRT